VIPSLSAMDKPVEKRKGLPRGAWIAIAIALVTLGVLLVALPTIRRWSQADSAVDGAGIRIGKVTRGDLVRDASAQGKIVAALHPTLFSPAAGIVVLSTKAGAAVKKGDLLARVESPELRSRFLQESSTLQSIRSAYERQKIASRQAALRNNQNVDLLVVKLSAAERLLERAQRTFDEGLMNRTDFEKARDDLKIAQLELSNARETAKLEKETADFDVRDRELSVERQASVVGELKRQVEGLALTAPFDGMVASVALQDRDAVAINGPVLTVVSLTAYEVELAIPENYASDVLPGSKAEILYEGRTFPGHVTVISPEVKDGQVSGTAVFDGETPATLKQSQRVSVRLVFETRPNVLKAPRGPFLESGAGRSAYVVTNGVATKRDIATGAVSVTEVEIVSGLAEGDALVLSDTAPFAGAKTVLIRN